MSFWKSTPDPEAVPAAVPAEQGPGWWNSFKDRVGMGEPEPLEAEEPTLLQQAREATTLNRVSLYPCSVLLSTWTLHIVIGFSDQSQRRIALL